jgi:LCP family protein required for cell wall assembly
MDNKIDENNQEIKIPPLKRKKGRRLTTAGKIAAVAFFLLCISFGFWLSSFFSEPLIPEDKPVNPDTVYKPQDMLNILFLGVDQRKNEASRTDVIILASIDLNKKEVHLLSILRDTRVEIPGKNIKRRINHAHAVGGAELTVQTVEKFLKVPVHYYVETNFEGFSNAIDILGGITLNVERRMYLPSEGINLRPGFQKLNGHDALSYVRWRGDGTGDIGRVERQQKFFQTLADQTMQLSTVWKIPQLIGELREHVKTDMELQKMIQLANKFKDLKNLELHTYTLPGYPDDVHFGGSYWIADQKELKKILEQIYGEEINDRKAVDLKEDEKA